MTALIAVNGFFLPSIAATFKDKVSYEVKNKNLDVQLTERSRYS